MGFKNLAVWTAVSVMACMVKDVAAIPAYGNLAGLSQRQVDEYAQTMTVKLPPTPPGPLADSSMKLVADADHPYRAPRPLIDHRGPCPGLNTLANHGYLPRNGIATPAQLINAVMEGFNMENKFATFVTYAAFIVDGNPFTNLVSIGGKTVQTGLVEPGSPAIIGGLNTNGVFEGDTSTTRSDFFFGDNHSLNQTLWDQFVDYSNRFGGGKYDVQAASQLRYRRVQESIAHNPNFDYTSPRYFTAYAESVFPINFFIDGRKDRSGLEMSDATSFFVNERFPTDFHRAPAPASIEHIRELLADPALFVPPGRNTGGVNTFTYDPNSADFSKLCLLYNNFVKQTVLKLYPNPTGILRDIMKVNLQYLFDSLAFPNCTQEFPYGK